MVKRSDASSHPVGTMIIWGLALASLLLVPVYDKYLIEAFSLPLYMVAMIPVVLVFGVSLLLSGRLFFSVLLTHCAFLVLIYANTIKYPALVAPVMFEDLLFFQNPASAYGLFSEYIGIRASKVVIALLILTVIGWMLWRERPRLRLLPRLLVLLAVLLISQQLISVQDVRKAYRQMGVEDMFWFQSDNLKKNGLYTVFALSAVNTNPGLPATDPDITARLAQKHAGSALPDTDVLPNIIYYLSESLFDPAIMQAYERCELFTLLCKLGDTAQVGVFDVPAYGGGTTRTEFAVLTGVNPERFRRQLNMPYRKVMYQQANSMAWEMRARGYRTIVIHPNHAEFYNRNVAMPNLGFDEFISREDFSSVSPQNGTYINDIDLNQKVFSSIDASEQPVFILAISIENHGPWGKRRIRDTARLNNISVPADLPPESQQKLREYLYHVQYAEEALQELSEYVLSSAEPMVLFFFGDHLPALGKVFAQIGFDDQRPAPAQDSFFIYLKNHAHSRLPDRLGAHETTPAILQDLNLLRPNEFYDLYQLYFAWDDSGWNADRQQLMTQAQLQQLHWQAAELTVEH